MITIDLSCMGVVLFPLGMQWSKKSYFCHDKDSVRLSWKLMIRLLCILCVYLFFPISALYSAIVLYTPDTEVTFKVTDCQNAQQNTNNPLFCLCEINMLAKHVGYGRVFVSHTPLSHGKKIIPYRLEYEYKKGFRVISEKGFFYTANPDRPVAIVIAKLWVELSFPLLEEEKEDLVSNVYFNLVLEK